LTDAPGSAIGYTVGPTALSEHLRQRSAAMIQFYFNTGPNPMKVALLLEEIGLDYEFIPVDAFRGEQFSSAFSAINPNNKLPALIDGDAVIFDSNAILLYLAEKTGQFLSDGSSKERGELLSWLMFVATGVGPYSGQAVHFRHFAPEPKDYAVDRYVYEARRHYGILDAHLADRSWMLNNTYSIVDMAVWGWARNLPFVLGPGSTDEFPNLGRLVAEIDARPAAVRADALKHRHAFKTERDQEFRRNMFRHIEIAN
jgi:GST-like protein